MSLELLGVLGAGALTFLTPCVLPLVPIYLSALVGGDFRQLAGARARGQLLLRAAWFSLGFVAVFTALGLTASSLGAFLADHKVAVQAFGAVLLALFGLKFLGWIRIPWLDRTLRADNQRFATRLGWLNALAMGLVFAAGWSPCVGPVLGAVLTYTASAASSPAEGALFLAIYGLGFALPLLGVALFAEAGARWLGRLGAHLRKVEVVLGAGLLLVAGSMALDLLPDFGPRPPQAPAAASAPAAPGAAERALPEPVMTAFVSRHCPVCERMKPTLEGLVQQCDGNKVRVRVVDVSLAENRGAASAHRLVGVPTFVFTSPEGSEVARLVGEQSEAALRQALSALRGEPCPGITSLPGAATPIEDLTPAPPPPVACKTALLGAEPVEAPAPSEPAPDPSSSPLAPAPPEPACGT